MIVHCIGGHCVYVCTDMPMPVNVDADVLVVVVGSGRTTVIVLYAILY